MRVAEIVRAKARLVIAQWRVDQDARVFGENRVALVHLRELRAAGLWLMRLATTGPETLYAAS